MTTVIENINSKIDVIQEKTTGFFSNFITNFKDRSSITFKLTIGIIAVIVIVILIWWYRKRMISNRLNPRFFPNGKDGSKAEVIKNNLIYTPESGYEYSYFMWLYIDGMDYKYGEWKHILTKGNFGINATETCPSIWIHPKNNTIRVSVTTTAGIDNIDIDDIPVYKWVSFAVVVLNNTIEIYVNGKLSHTKNLSAIPKLNNGDLLVNNGGGFRGVITSLYYLPMSLKPKDIETRHNGGPYGSNVFERFYNAIFRRNKSMESMVEGNYQQDGKEAGKLLTY